MLAAVEAASPFEVPPARGLHDLMASTYAVIFAHRDLVPLYLARQGPRGPSASAR